jgi:hypothetical protein
MVCLCSSSAEGSFQETYGSNAAYAAFHDDCLARSVRHAIELGQQGEALPHERDADVKLRRQQSERLHAPLNQVKPAFAR